LWADDEDEVSMKIADSKDVPNYLLIVCAFAGAFVGFLMPGMSYIPPEHSGIIRALVAFELNYINLITTVGALVLLYWLLRRKVRGREALIACGALGLVSARLILASLSYLRKL
jgi:hypothetical protein